MRYGSNRERVMAGVIAVALAAVLGAVACERSPLEPRFDEDRQAYVVETQLGDLVQTVELSSATPATGDTLRVRSTVRNTGADREIDHRVCGLDVRGIDLTRYGARCGGYSARSRLEPGDSVVGEEFGVVRSESGTYDLEVRHLVEPEHWIVIEVRVDG